MHIIGSAGQLPFLFLHFDGNKEALCCLSAAVISFRPARRRHSLTEQREHLVVTELGNDFKFLFVGVFIFFLKVPCSAYCHDSSGAASAAYFSSQISGREFCTTPDL